MLKPRYSNQFKKDYKTIQKRGYNIKLLKELVELLVREDKLPNKYKEHCLIGFYSRI